MNEVVLFYNPFLPEMRVSVNGASVSRYSAINSMRNARFAAWCTDILREIRKEVNGSFSLRCISTEFICDCMEQIADMTEPCTDYEREQLPVDDSIYERLEELKNLGLSNPGEMVVPVFAVSNRALTEEIYDLICDGGMFEEEDADLVWEDCPPAGLRLHLIRQEREVPRRCGMVLALCGSENDRIQLNGNYDIYAIVPGVETRFLKKEKRCLYFEVDPDAYENLILDIVAEGVLSPYLSETAARLEERSASDEMRQRLAYVCAGNPVCRLQVEEKLDVGREYEVSCMVYPPDAYVRLRYGTDHPELIATGMSSIRALAEGRAYILAYAEGDPYPVASRPVTILSRELIRNMQGIKDIELPEGGRKEVCVFLEPSTAVNGSEVRWNSSNESVIRINVNGTEGEGCMLTDGKRQRCNTVFNYIEAVGQGHCEIMACTPETNWTIQCYVLPVIESIWTSATSVEVKVGQYQSFKYSARPRGAYGASELSISSDNPVVAEYSNGYIVGRSKGTCLIRIQTKDRTKSTKIKVTVKKGLFG